MQIMWYGFTLSLHGALEIHRMFFFILKDFQTRSKHIAYTHYTYIM